MKYLFLDTTENLTIGLLDESFKWLELEQVETKKTSEIIHFKIHEILSKHSLSAQSDFSIISVSGPGSYTGMRITEGVCQIFELEGKKIYSFHSFLIPELMGIHCDYCCYQAFKNEIYIYSKLNPSKLISAESFKSEYLIDNSLKLMTYGTSFSEYSEVENVRNIFLASPEKALDKVVLLGLRQDTFYFRPVEVEFKQNL